MVYDSGTLAAAINSNSRMESQRDKLLITVTVAA